MKNRSLDVKDGDSKASEETASGGNISYLCMKYNRQQQGDQLACQDPDLYCKFRTQCLIHYKEKRNRRKSQTTEERTA
jgi:hypothetical protein